MKKYLALKIIAAVLGGIPSTFVTAFLIYIAMCFFYFGRFCQDVEGMTAILLIPWVWPIYIIETSLLFFWLKKK